MPDIVEATNVLVINAGDGPPTDPRTCLQMLVNLGGNIKAFAEKYSADRQEQCHILYQARKILEAEPLYLERWDNAIRAYQHNYWSLLQCDALEALGSALEEPGKEATAVAKTVLTPLTALLTAEAKRGPVEDDAPPPNPDGGTDDFSEDDAILAKALGLA